MQAPKRRPQPGLIEQLLQNPHCFNFFQAVRIVDLWLRRESALGKTLSSVLRFKNSVSLAFPASQIEELTLDASVPALHDAKSVSTPELQQLRRITITPAFMGFLGVNGVLPRSYTATISEQIHFDKHHGGRAFFDTFFHRSMLLFYRAWAVCRVECRARETGRDGFLAQQLALAGKHVQETALPMAAASSVSVDSAAFPDEVVARYAAMIRHRPMTGEMIEGVLAEYFGVPFRFQPFVGDWVGVAPENATVLGDRNHQLGYGAMLGEHYWRRDAIARLWVGPLSGTNFDSFLPTGSAGKALKALLALFAVPTVAFEVRLILQAADITPACLDTQRGLGQGAFLITQAQTANDAQTRYLIAF